MKLSDIIASIGNIESSIAKQISSDNITEPRFVDMVKVFFEKKYRALHFFTSKEVNVRKWGSSRRSQVDVLREWKHPLHPDIDLLYCQVKDGEWISPVVGVEVKLFSRHRGRDKVEPQTSSQESFYAGLDQAISLLLYGLDSVYLWHVFPIPWRVLESCLKEKTEKALMKRLQEFGEFSAAYSGIVAGTIEMLNLPMGYVPTYLCIDAPKGCCCFGLWKGVNPKRNPYLKKAASLKLRRLILENLEIKDMSSNG